MIQLVLYIMTFTEIAFLMFSAGAFVSDLSFIKSFSPQEKKSFLLQQNLGLFFSINAFGLFVINHALAAIVYGLGTIITNLFFYRSDIGTEGGLLYVSTGLNAQSWRRFYIFLGILSLICSVLFLMGIISFGQRDLIPFSRS